MLRLTLNSKPLNLIRIFLIIIILVLLAGNIFLGIKYSVAQKELAEIEQVLKSKEFNEKTLNFTSFFIEKILKGEKEVDFETRLQLETSVRDLEDTEILVQWEKFVGSETEIEAQREVKNLLELLVSKIKI